MGQCQSLPLWAKVFLVVSGAGALIALVWLIVDACGAKSSEKGSEGTDGSDKLAKDGGK